MIVVFIFRDDPCCFGDTENSHTETEDDDQDAV